MKREIVIIMAEIQSTASDDKGSGTGIRSRATNQQQYTDGWERIFGKVSKDDKLNVN